MTDLIQFFLVSLLPSSLLVGTHLVADAKALVARCFSLRSLGPLWLLFPQELLVVSLLLLSQSLMVVVLGLATWNDPHLVRARHRRFISVVRLI